MLGRITIKTSGALSRPLIVALSFEKHEAIKFNCLYFGRFPSIGICGGVG